jgi:hypothetical protein
MITNALFSFDSSTGRKRLTNRRVNKILRQTWALLDWPKLTSHSFRVGGASLLQALKVSIDDIKKLGRWTTDCYQRYIKPIAAEDVVTSTAILQLNRF